MPMQKVQLMSLAELKPANRNPKLHAGADIQASIARFGFVEPMVLDGRTGRLVAGHGRLEALQALKGTGAAPPEGVATKGGDWAVPVLTGWASKSDADAEAYVVTSNRLVEIGGWDDKMLGDMLGSLDKVDGGLAGTGYSSDAVAELLASTAEQTTGVTAPDDVPETPAESWVQTGDLFELGAHRLLCGDSTKTEDVSRLMGEHRAGLMNTDPPYGVAYDNADRPNPGVAKPRVAKDELCDEKLQAFLESAFRAACAAALTENAAWYLWHAHLTQGYFAAAAAAARVVLHRQIIWVKPVLLLGRGQYHWKHEPCFMGWVKGNQPPDYGHGDGERNQTTVWEIGSVTQAERKEFNHATPKPVGLFEIPIIKHLKRGEVAYEPFSGSGPQIIAAEMHGRRCFAMELEPRYVQVAIERWEKFTGKKAEKLPSGNSTSSTAR